LIQGIGFIVRLTSIYQEHGEYQRKGYTPMSNLDKLMPDTSGINFYTEDPDLSHILRHSLSAEDFERAHTILKRMGEVASQEMDELAQVANRQGPVLVQYDKRGQRVDEVVFHPAYHELERITYEEFAIPSIASRTNWGRARWQQAK
jgi:acyl-CoA dehydrogenase